MTSFYDHRAAAIRRFYNDSAKDRDTWEKRFACHLWYSAERDHCLAYEPAEADDSDYYALSMSTQRTALFGKEEE